MSQSVSSEGGQSTASRELAVTISIRTILLVGVAVAIAWALASIGDVLLLIFVSIFNIAAPWPVADAMEGRFSWSRGTCSTVLVLGIVCVVGIALLILFEPIVDGVRSFSDNLPRLVDEARHSDLGRLIN